MKGSGGEYSAELTSRAGNLFVSRSFRVGNSGEEGMAHAEMRALRAEGAWQFPADAAREEAAPESDDDFDFPPTAHPGRELFTASLFVLLIMAFAIWGGWKLTALIASLI
jgi:hypothetical protein